jgi:hypothetical protein
MSKSCNGCLPLKQRKRLNAPPTKQPWAWFTLEILSSDAYRSLSGNAMKILNRILIEHMNHAGLENGRLPVSYDDFVKYGMRRHAIRPALNELIAAGFIRISQPGRRVHGEDQGRMAEYRLTWLPVATPADFQAASNDWNSPRQYRKTRADKIFSPSVESVTVPSVDSVTRLRDKPGSIIPAFSSVDSVTTYNILHVGRQTQPPKRRSQRQAT